MTSCVTVTGIAATASSVMGRSLRSRKPPIWQADRIRIACSSEISGPPAWEPISKLKVPSGSGSAPIVASGPRTRASPIDLLCLDGDGGLIVLELKRDKTEREIVAQVLDYGSYVKTIQPDELRRIFAKYQKDYSPHSPAKTIEEAFRDRFKGQAPPEELGTSHELVIVAATLDSATESFATASAST